MSDEEITEVATMKASSLGACCVLAINTAVRLMRRNALCIFSSSQAMRNDPAGEHKECEDAGAQGLFRRCFSRYRSNHCLPAECI